VKIREILAYLFGLLLLLVAVIYSIDFSLRDPFRYRLSLDAPASFLFLALVPGVLAITYHLVTVRDRRQQNLNDVEQYYKWLSTRGATRGHQQTTRVVSDTKGPVSANAATMLLIAVFLFVGIVMAYTKWSDTPLAGIVFAGLGAYISVLYFMVGRIYASALSSRFLMSSALGSASAVVMGWVFATIGVAMLNVDAKSFNLNSIVFLTGLFHKWAFDALRRRARKVFGQPDPETAELPLDIIEGVDDVHADLLSEYGASTVQGVAKAEPGELCERTLVPLDRLCDWINQAMLIVFLKKQILAARALGIRNASNLVTIYDQALVDPQGPMSKLLDTLGEKISMPRASVDAMAMQLRDNYSVQLLYALQEGKEYVPATAPGPLATLVASELSTKYDFVNAAGTTQYTIQLRP